MGAAGAAGRHACCPRTAPACLPHSTAHGARAPACTVQGWQEGCAVAAGQSARLRAAPPTARVRAGCWLGTWPCQPETRWRPMWTRTSAACSKQACPSGARCHALRLPSSTPAPGAPAGGSRRWPAGPAPPAPRPSPQQQLPPPCRYAHCQSMAQFEYNDELARACGEAELPDWRRRMYIASGGEGGGPMRSAVLCAAPRLWMALQGRARHSRVIIHLFILQPELQGSTGRLSRTRTVTTGVRRGCCRRLRLTLSGRSQ